MCKFSNHGVFVLCSFPPLVDSTWEAGLLLGPRFGGILVIGLLAEVRWVTLRVDENLVRKGKILLL